MKNLQSRLLWLFTELKYFLSSKIFLKNFAGMLGIVIGTIILVFLFLRLFTRHNSYVTIPSYVGKTVEQAKALKGARHFNIMVIDSNQYQENLEPGEIIIQDPAPEAQAKKGRKIYVTINAFKVPTKKVPRIWGIQLAMAERRLKYNKFEWDIIKRPDRAVNTILEIRVKETGEIIKPYREGEAAPRLPQGTKLELIVAEGRGAAIAIPNLVCMTYSEAKRTIEGLNSNVGAIMLNGNVSDTLNAYVWRQDPSAYDGLTINVGDEINLWLQMEQPLQCRESFIEEEEETDLGDYDDSDEF